MIERIKIAFWRMILCKEEERAELSIGYVENEIAFQKRKARYERVFGKFVPY